MKKKEMMYLGSLLGIMLFNVVLFNLNYCLRYDFSLVYELCQAGSNVLKGVLIFIVSIKLFNYVNKTYSKKQLMYTISLILTILVGLNYDGHMFYFLPVCYLLLVGYVLPYVLKEKDYMLGTILAFALAICFIKQRAVITLFYIVLLSLSLYLHVSKKNKKWIIIGVVGTIALVTLYNFPYVLERFKNTYMLYTDTLIPFLKQYRFIGEAYAFSIVKEILYTEKLIYVFFTGTFGLFPAFLVLIANIKTMLMSKDVYLNTDNHFIRFVILVVNVEMVLGLAVSLVFPSTSFSMFGISVSDVILFFILVYYMKKGSHSYE